ncbi:hypothetical protein Q8F57_024295 [Paraburkholderia terrae]|uniref:hypothetical protein n=1 Tax=Paraburkholderia terrae TaxID=311230 RepID=UPI00296B40FB|nr:hypothetical protein [Paraburkholderia terrae]MDW3657313.1 hypothetical protein [Paraburkholderia terrae]
MKVSELLELLREADPDARVMLLSDGSTEADAHEVRCIHPSGVNWTRERGLDKGREYEFLYPGEPHRDVRTDCEQVTYARVSVVLLVAEEEFSRSARPG